MPQPKTGATQYHSQLELPDKGRAIKQLVVCWVLLSLIAPIVQTEKYKYGSPQIFLVVGSDDVLVISLVY